MRINATWVVLGIGLIPPGCLLFVSDTAARHPWTFVTLSLLYLLLLWLVSEFIGRVAGRFRREGKEGRPRNR
ncbi:MAG: hypothetical protein Kow006_21210 [Gammaproteobacteria bacterium]